MATTQMTRHLMKHIINEIYDKMDTLYEQEKMNEPDNGSWGQFIYDTTFGYLKPVLSQIPSEWFCKVTSIYVRNVGNIEVNMSFMLDDDQPWPYYAGQNEFAEWGSTNHGVGYVSLKSHPVWANFRNAVVDYENRINKITSEQKNLICHAKTICKTYKTLEEALKSWPALLEFLPENIKQKYNER